MNTPAVTIVAAWMSALTGVGPSIASGSQTCSGSCADLAAAATKSNRAMASIVVGSESATNPAFVAGGQGCGARNEQRTKCVCALLTTVLYASVPKVLKIRKMASIRPKSPMTLTTKAFLAAATADGRVYQKPISRNEARPTPAQPANRKRKLSAATSSAIAKTKRLRKEKKRQ